MKKGTVAKMSLQKGLGNVLVQFKRAGDIEASAVISRAGLLMASGIPSGIHGETFSAMSATMLGAAETARTLFITSFLVFTYPWYSLANKIVKEE